MKKVVYSVTRYRKDDIDKISGLGCITDADLVIACMSKAGKLYICVFEAYVKHYQPISDRPGELKDSHYEIREVQLDTGKDNYETREIELNYNILYKFADWRKCMQIRARIKLRRYLFTCGSKVSGNVAKLSTSVSLHLNVKRVCLWVKSKERNLHP